MRMSKDVYFMSLAILASKRSTCIRRQVGCIAVLHDRVVATGYNGTVSQTPHCTIDTCYRTINKIPSGQQLENCRAVHAEQNVICQAAITGTSIYGATVYVTTNPCFTCLKLLSQVGVKRIVVQEESYPSGDLAQELCTHLGLEYYYHWTDQEKTYFRQLEQSSVHFNAS